MVLLKLGLVLLLAGGLLARLLIFLNRLGHKRRRKELLRRFGNANKSEKKTDSPSGEVS